MTAAQVTAAARKYMKPDEFAFAFAGDFANAKVAPPPVK